MYEYKHGGNAIFEKNNKDILDLSANINPLGIPNKVIKAIAEEINFSDRYPDNYSTELRKKISEFEKLDKNFIFCSNGASDIIFRIALSIKPKKSLVLAPTFSDYERAIISTGGKIKEYFLNDNFVLDEKIVSFIDNEKFDLIFICNPNNPTGLLTDKSLLEKIIYTCHKNNTYIVIDECFMDFVEDSNEYSCKNLLSKYNNIIILKAFTKFFALPGIRLGYCFCSNTNFIKNLYFFGPDWSVSNIAQTAGIISLEDTDSYIKKSLEFISKERIYIKNELKNIGFEVFNSKANFIFFKNPYDFDLQDELNKFNIRIRSCSNYKNLSPSFYRVAVSKTEDNKKFVERIKMITRNCFYKKKV